jgi:Xaa-Pro dipeptidase
MKRDVERSSRNAQALVDMELDAFVCALPLNVLLLTGYWPVIGTSVAIATRDEYIVLLVPEDELSLAEKGWADRVVSYRAGSLDELKDMGDILSPEISRAVPELDGKTIGFENDAVSVPVSYAAITVLGAAMRDVIANAFPTAKLFPGGEILARLRGTLTPNEIGRVRVACQIARGAYLNGRDTISLGQTENEVAAAFRAPLSVAAGPQVLRADGFTFCMSGKNSFEASAAFQLSRSRQLQTGDLALMHCNSYADGFWTDITRTYCVGSPDERRSRMYEAVFAALQASFEAIAPGIRASEVDRAARDVLTDKGFGKEFVHGLGHGVGFAAIDHNAQPRLHPASQDRLETGMVFNIEPAIYLKDLGGMRHCDMGAVSETGAELLTPFQRDIESMIIRG